MPKPVAQLIVCVAVEHTGHYTQSAEVFTGTPKHLIIKKSHFRSKIDSLDSLTLFHTPVSEEIFTSQLPSLQFNNAILSQVFIK